MDYKFEFNEEKNITLKNKRKISFEQIIGAILSGDAYSTDTKPAEKYSHQKAFAVKIDGYFWYVPYVLNEERKEIFLKTAYQDRRLNKKMRRGDSNDKL